MQRVMDYQQMDEIIGDELLPALTSSGLPRKIAIGELIKKFSGGIIDVTAPPYNVVPDGRLYQDGCTILIGSNVLSANDDVFSATDVGKPIRVFSAAADTGGALETTIIDFVNSRQVKLGKVASTNAINRHACWGTINTVGMRRAMADAASPDVARRGGVVLLPPGSIITASLPFGNGAAIKGWGRKTSRFIHWHEVNEPRAFLYNDDQTVTYAGVPYAAADQVMMDFGINGNRWLYVAGQGGDADGYQAAATAVLRAKRAGLVPASAEPCIRKLDAQAFESVGAVRAAYDAGNSSSYVVAMIGARGAVATLLKRKGC